MNNIHIIIDGKSYTAPRGTKLSTLMEESHIQMPCGGKGNCGKCRVVVSGEVSPLSETEKHHLSEQDIKSGVRLACLTCAEGDCVVESMVTSPKAQQICLATDIPENLSDTLCRPVFEHYGVAVDIGTTTIAVCLYDREFDKLAEVGLPNPQTLWGADVVSRMEHELEGGGSHLTTAVTEAIDQAVQTLAVNAHISAGDIDGMVVTGNTVMLSFLTGTSTEPLTHAPFEANRLFGEWTTAKDLFLTAVKPTTAVYLMPCVSAFVGGDLVAALMACDFCHGEDTKLLVDIGTNGEMALWHKGNLYVCSTAAGPAFEGAGISMGMAGGIGAVDHVTLSGGNITPHVIGDTTPVGICGSGIVDAVACLLDSELMDETGYLENDPTPIAPPVSLTQADIRGVQLAKSAICGGLLTLMHTAHLTPDAIDALFVAGGFGSYLNVASAGKIGLIPEALVEKVKVLGNAALTGASMLLLDDACIPHAQMIASQAQGVDLATDPYFADAFMQGMMFE